ncbi:MFS transporter [Leucobacter aridicollis]|uniref:MFS transporter n=1 Tax=Leucobacter aridicollis TaxID=283878 RepID=UPI000E654C3F|nr:MFS transporter [Leucobacter aridicollis]UTX52993.1 MFS transporter [Leucobacter aridicollis]
MSPRFQSGTDHAHTSLLVHAALVQVLSYGLRAAIAYEMLALGKDGAWLGYSAAAFALPPLLLALPSGALVRRFGERTSLVIGAVAFVLAILVVLVVGENPLGLIAASALIGCGVLFSVVGEQSWVMSVAQGGRLDFAFGMYTLATSTGQMLGPLLLLIRPFTPTPGALNTAPALTEIAWLCFGGAVIIFGLSCGIPPSRAGGRAGTGGGAVQLLRSPGVPAALYTSSIVLTSLDIAIMYLPLLAESRGISAGWVSAMLVARGAATMLSRLTLSAMTRRFGRRPVLIGGSGLAGIALVSFVLPLPVPAILLACALYGFAAGTVQPLTMSWMTLITTLDQRSTAASLRLLGNRIGQTGVPLIAAGISSFGGAGSVFTAVGAGLLAAAALSRAAPNDTR